MLANTKYNYTGQQQYAKAATITAIICGVLLCFFALYKWTMPTVAPPALSEGIEVNLGNSDMGSGDIEPAIPGEPSNESVTTNEPSNTAAASQLPVQQQQVVENDDPSPEPTNVKPVVVPKAVIKPTVKPVEAKKVLPAATNNAAVAAPKAPTPKAVFSGGTNKTTGGNNADSYNGVRNQGIAGGKGNQGSPNGNPNSDSYKGNASSGSAGGAVKIRKGLQGRNIVRFPSFTDDFDEPAQIAVDITVDEQGKVTRSAINLYGTTKGEPYRSIALKKANQLKFNAGSQEQTGTIVFEFKVN